MNVRPEVAWFAEQMEKKLRMWRISPSLSLTTQGVIDMGRRDLREEMRKVKKAKTLSEFKREMNILHTRAYNLAVKHYTEAAEIVLPPKLQKALHDKANEIKELWDGINEVKLEDTEAE